jgi:hypothetical protein
VERQWQAARSALFGVMVFQKKILYQFVGDASVPSVSQYLPISAKMLCGKSAKCFSLRNPEQSDHRFRLMAITP